MSEPDELLLRHAPVYATEQARLAIERARELQATGVLRKGLYYLALVDLVGSTDYTQKHGNKSGDERIERFVSDSIEALNESNPSNIGIFIKEIGDAVLFLFSHFPDILRWHRLFRSNLATALAPIEIRTAIHLGEVHVSGGNPLSLAVSEVFKMEKSVPDNAVYLSETAFRAAWPTVDNPAAVFSRKGAVSFDGYPSETPLISVDLEGLSDDR